MARHKKAGMKKKIMTLQFDIFLVGHEFNIQTLLNFMFFKKSTENYKIFTVDLTFTVSNRR